MTASTSRIGRKPIKVPAGVVVNIAAEQITIKGPKGQTAIPVHPFVNIKLDENVLHLSSHDPKVTGHIRSGSGLKLNKSIVGTLRAKIDNSITGVTKGFERKLVLVGVGYKAQTKGKVLGLTLGYSHPVDFPIPEGIVIETPSQTEIIVKGIDKHLVGHVSAKIRGYRAPEPYKGKGIRYADETVYRKETKKK